MCPRDTSPEAWRQYLEVVRRMTPEERMSRCFALTRTVQKMAESGVRSRHPEAGEREVFLRALELRLGPELFRRAYGDVPERS